MPHSSNSHPYRPRSNSGTIAGRFPNSAFQTAIVLVVLLITPAIAQNTASISGRVLDENGAAVDAMVSASGPSALLRRVSTLPDGTYTIASLPPGNYLLCAEATMDRPDIDPFVNSCLWLKPDSPPLQLAAGKSLTGVSIPMQRGHRFVVRVNDPAKLLPPAVGRNAGNSLSLSIVGPSGIRRNIPIAAFESTGRVHQIVIPFNAAHSLQVRSSMFSVSNEQGQAIASTQTLTVGATPSSRPPDLVVNVAKGAVK